jgi:AmmeMemoRadiSam system protein A
METLGEHDRQRLLILARRSLDARVRRRVSPEADTAAPLDRRRGAFVSLHCRGELRGCLGRISPDRAVGRVVADLGAAVSDSDSRFPPVSVDELQRLALEISVLVPERPVRVEEIEIGRHGLIVEYAGRRGLLLPQVAMRHGWDALTFLRHTFIKAGLHPHEWDRATVSAFEAQVFGEG